MVAVVSELREKLTLYADTFPVPHKAPEWLERVSFATWRQTEEAGEDVHTHNPIGYVEGGGIFAYLKCDRCGARWEYEFDEDAAEHIIEDRCAYCTQNPVRITYLEALGTSADEYPLPERFTDGLRGLPFSRLREYLMRNSSPCKRKEKTGG